MARWTRRKRCTAYAGDVRERDAEIAAKEAELAEGRQAMDWHGAQQESGVAERAALQQSLAAQAAAREQEVQELQRRLDAAVEEAAEMGKATAEKLRDAERSEERRVGEECRSRWSPDH